MQTITKLDVTYDVDLLWRECSCFIARHGWGTLGQISLTHRPQTDASDRAFDGVGTLTESTERDFSVLNEECRGTYIEDLIRSLPYQLGRLRIMRVRGRTCYSVHRDPTRRIHLPLITNPQALMVFPDEPLVVHLPADGHVYLTNTVVPHTAMNGSLDERYHLVGALIE